MIKDNYIVRLASQNTHLLDIFSEPYYLELGNINYNTLKKLLRKKRIQVNDIANFDIQNQGIGASNVTNEELKTKLPYLFFDNVNKKDQSLELFITYGLLSYKDEANKEKFSPIILIPIRMYISSDEIWFENTSVPIENIILIKELKKKKIEVPYHEKFDSIYSLDKYCMFFHKLKGFTTKIENYLTFAKTNQPQIVINHDHYSLQKRMSKSLGNKYYIDDEHEIYNITPLNNKQRQAVQRASAGNSFGINGCLGTGKTTTLINIASNGLAHDKKVLYISNKIETLAEIEKLFTEYNIDCLIKNLTQLGTKIEGLKIKQTTINDDNEFIKKRLTHNYKVIDEYEVLLNDRILNFRFIDVIKSILSAKKPEENIRIDNLEAIYKHEYDEIIKSLAIIEEDIKKIGEFKESKFINIPIHHNIKYPNQIITLLFQIHKLFKELANKNEILVNDHQFKPISNYARFRSVINTFNTLDLDKLPNSWHDTEIFKQAQENYVDLKNAIYSIQEIELYIDWEFKNINQIDINSYIKTILGSYYNRKDGALINKVLKDMTMIISKLHVGNYNCNVYLESLSRIKGILGWDFNDDQAIELVVSLADYLNEHYTYYKWLSKSHTIRDQISKLQQKMNKYHQLEEKISQFFSNPQDIPTNISVLEKLKTTTKLPKKFKDVNLNSLITTIKQYKTIHHNIKKIKSDYRLVTGRDYDQNYNILDEYDSCHRFINQITDKDYQYRIIKFLSNINSEYLENHQQDFNRFSRAYKVTKQIYQFILEYIKVDGYKTQVQIVEFINNFYQYILEVRIINRKMCEVVKKGDEIIDFEIYLKLQERLIQLNRLKTKIKSNRKYKILYEDLFENENTNINNLGTLIKNYNQYLDSLIIDDKNDVDFQKLKTVKAILDECKEIIFDLNESFKLYSKIFKEGIGGYYYDDFSEVIEYLEELLGAKDELISYLEVTDQLKVLSKYKLYILNNLIINNQIKNIVEIFNYTYFKNLYNMYLIKHPLLDDTNSMEIVLEDTISLEKALIDSHINVLNDKKINRLSATRNRKDSSNLLHLATTAIVNRFINLKNYDLIIIDDAHLLNANEYYKAIRGKQVVFAGENIVGASSIPNLLSRIRPTNLMTFNYRYPVTPIRLLKLVNLNGVFGEVVSKNQGIEIIVRDELELIIELIKNECIINMFIPDFLSKRQIFDRITQLLIDKNYSKQYIENLLTSQLNIVDLFSGYLYNADYNIINLENYYLYDQDFISENILDTLLMCREKLYIIDNKNVFCDNSNKFINAISSIFINDLDNFNYNVMDILLKIGSRLNKHGVIVHGSFGDLSLVVEKDNKYYGILLFSNPDTSHFDILEDYREYYYNLYQNNLKVIIVWIIDLVRDFDDVVDRLIKEISYD